MSLGGGIGAAIGGVVGFFVGGPAGIFYGAAIGMSVGMMIDPLKPETANSMDPVKFEVTSNEIGKTIPDALGTVKLTGLFMYYGNEHAEAQYQSVSGGKGGGGSSDQLTGYKYYMTFGEGICIGPVDTLYTIYSDNDVILWQGVLNRPDSGGQATISISGFGTIVFYFGTDDQSANADAASIVGSTRNSPLRGLCWAFFKDCCIGDYNRCPTYSFVLRKSPSLDFSRNAIIDQMDYNPAHALWYVLNNMTGLPVAWLSSADFAAAALTLFNEQRGISVLMDNQQTALSWIENINNHINGIVRYGNDGCFHPKLIRNDYTVANLLAVDESVFTDEPTIVRKSWIDTQNEVLAQYSEIVNRPSVTTGTLYYRPLWNYPIVADSSKTDWTTVDCVNGYYEWHALALKSNGTLWAKGQNGNGQLGTGDTSDRSTWTQIGSDSDWSSVYCCPYKSFAIKTDGSLYGAGMNGYGQLGIGDTTERHVFTKISDGWSAVASTGAWAVSFAMKTDGTMWQCGRNYGLVWAQVATGHTATSITLKDEGDRLFIDGNGNLYEGDGNLLMSGSKWTSVSGGSRFARAIRNDGTLWAISNDNQTFTQESTKTDWKMVSSCRNDRGDTAVTTGGTSYAVDSSGALYTIDGGNAAQLLDNSGKWIVIASPHAVSTGPFFGIKAPS